MSTVKVAPATTSWRNTPFTSTSPTPASPNMMDHFNYEELLYGFVCMASLIALLATFILKGKS